MLESVVKGMIFQMSSFTMVDKKTGKENGMINLQYIYKATEDTPTKMGYTTGQAYCLFSDDLFKKVKNDYLLKSTDLTFKLVPDYKDSARYTSKLTKINDFVIKQ